MVGRFDSKKLLIVMGFVIIAILIDSEIGVIADFIPEQISSSAGLATFIGIAIIFAVTQYFILSYVKQSNKDKTRAKALNLDITYWIVSIAQYILVGILVYVILQIIVAQQYSIVTLYASHVISYGLWITTLGLLAKAFFSWYKLSNKNIMVLILAISMIAYVINGIAGLASYLDMLSQQKPIVASNDIAYFPEFSIALLGSQIGLVNQIASSIAYILTWIGTVKLLYPNVKKTRQNQVLDCNGCCHDILSYLISSFRLGILHSI